MKDYIEIDIDDVSDLCDHILTLGTAPGPEGADIRAALRSVIYSLSRHEEREARNREWQEKEAARKAAESAPAIPAETEPTPETES